MTSTFVYHVHYAWAVRFKQRRDPESGEIFEFAPKIGLACSRVPASKLTLELIEDLRLILLLTLEEKAADTQVETRYIVADACELILEDTAGYNYEPISLN